MNPIKKIIRKILPELIIEFLYQSKNSLRFACAMFLHKIIRFIKPVKMPVNQDGKILIHLGCGEQNDKRFINIDILPFPHVHYVRNVEDLKIFPDKYGDLIYASHILEHIGHRRLIKVLKEWRRVLKDGGILRISVPDFDKIIDIYNTMGNNIKEIEGVLMGGQDYEYNFHKSAFNERYLKELLQLAGFSKVRMWDPKDLNYAFNDFSSFKLHGKYDVSLNIEGVK